MCNTGNIVLYVTERDGDFSFLGEIYPGYEITHSFPTTSKAVIITDSRKFPVFSGIANKFVIETVFCEYCGKETLESPCYTCSTSKHTRESHDHQHEHHHGECCHH